MASGLENIETIESPFRRFVTTIGVFPTAFTDAMTYYECLAYLVKYLEDTVIPAVNDNAEALAELQTLFVQLKTYVDNYFNDLDVQAEIDHKLDQMVENGTFQAILNDYVAPMLDTLNTKIDTKYDQLEGIIDSNVSDLSNRIAGVASGAPTAVSSISSMTDTSKIYVLTSDGNWYYWNGTAWTSGGVYQASQSTDDVAGLLYNQINENMKYFLGFELGIYNTNTGASISTNNRIRTQPMVFDYDVFIPNTENVRVYIFLLNSDDSFGSFAGFGANPRKGYFIPKGQHFKLFLDYDTAPADYPAIEDPEDNYLFSDFCILPYEVYKQEQIRALNRQGITVDPNNLKYNFNFIVGWRNNVVLEQYYDKYTRITTVNVIKAENDLVIPQNSTYDVYYDTYSSADETDHISGSWKNMTSGDLTIPAGTYFALTVTVHPHSGTATETTLYENYNNPIFKALTIYSDNTYSIDEKIDILKAGISSGTLASKYNNTTISTSKISDYMGIISNGKSDNYVFFTDPHTMGYNGTYTDEENNKYLSVVQKYYYQSPANFVVCGGDWLNTGDTPAQAKEKLSVVHGTCNYLFGGQIHQLVGNHDVNIYGANSERISYQTVANILNDKYGKNYYTFDSANARYYVLDSDSDDSYMGDYRWSQIDWMAKDLIANNPLHGVIMLHLIYPLLPTTSERTLFANNIASVISAYNAHTSVTLNGVNYDFSNCTGKIDYSLVGHCHMDLVEDMGGVPVIGTINLRAGSTPSFDLISVDYTNMTFKSIRIGQGSDRNITL